MKINYQKSVELATSLGYEEIVDENAYKGKCYVKGEKIWIHDISALKDKLEVDLDSELENLGYDVQAYKKYKVYTDEMADNEMIQFYKSITHSDGEPTYLADGVWLFPNGTTGKL